MKTTLTRCEMFSVLGAVAVTTIILSQVLGDNAPSKKITLGCIGMGGQGINLTLKMFLTHEDCQ